MSDTRTPPEARFDKRTLPHRQRRGEFTQAEVDAHLATLPDDAEEAVESTVRFAAPTASRAQD